jgi:cytochrome oxidase Cu insertion factor (SCO1/SenC/PrrC family)
MKSPFKFALAAIVVLVLAGGFVWLRSSNNPTPSIGGPFTLQDKAGHPVTDQAFRGKYMLVYFGYTTCPDVCPTTLADVEQALDSLGAKAAAIQPVFITVDPARDTPSVVGDYAANFGSRWVGLTGSAEQIATVAHEYRVYYAKHKTGDGPWDYTMDHSSILYLVGPDGRFVAPVAADSAPAAMAGDIARHVS